MLFNVFGSVGRDARGMVGDVISAWASIAGDQVSGRVVYPVPSFPAHYTDIDALIPILIPT